MTKPAEATLGNIAFESVVNNFIYLKNPMLLEEESPMTWILSQRKAVAA